MRPALFAAAAAAALTAAWPASAHVVASPSFLSTGGTATLGLSGPNERDEPMTSFSVAVPDGIEIVEARARPGWEARVEGVTATWNGGSLAPGADATFELSVDVSAEPGLVQLRAAQRYPGGEVVRWPVALTILPAASPEPRGFGWTPVAVLAGLVALGLTAGVAWRRRRARALQER